MYTPAPPLDDLAREAHADILASHPLPVDRSLLRRLVSSKMGRRVPPNGVVFISSGTFHKAFLVTLQEPGGEEEGEEIVARLARPFMPRLKTLSEIATMSYVRTRTGIPVPEVYCYDASANNVLGAEYILMSKAKGIPLSQLPSPYPRTLLRNIARMILELTSSKHTFNKIGSLYLSKHSSTLRPSNSTSKLRMPKTPAAGWEEPSSPFSFDMDTQREGEYEIGPIISWPFFGSSRGLVPSSSSPPTNNHHDPTEDQTLNRGPFPSTHAYLSACFEREIRSVQWENEGTCRGHRPHLGPPSLSRTSPTSTSSSPSTISSFSNVTKRLPPELNLNGNTNTGSGSGSETDTDTDSEDAFYRDYRASQRSTYLVSALTLREEAVRNDMLRISEAFHSLGVGVGEEDEVFALDLHDLSRENVFVDPRDWGVVTCVIDWESTCTRPLWQTHHLPSFLAPPPHSHSHSHSHYPHSRHHKTNEALFREEMTSLPGGREWLTRERDERGRSLRALHRVLEWDGWEEGIVDAFLGGGDGAGEDDQTCCDDSELAEDPNQHPEPAEQEQEQDQARGRQFSRTLPVPLSRRHLDHSTDPCDGIGGELGRRLEALITKGLGSERGGGPGWTTLSSRDEDGEEEWPDWERERDVEERREESEGSESGEERESYGPQPLLSSQSFTCGPSRSRAHSRTQTQTQTQTLKFTPLPHVARTSSDSSASGGSTPFKYKYRDLSVIAPLGINGIGIGGGRVNGVGKGEGEGRKRETQDRLAMFLAANGIGAA